MDGKASSFVSLFVTEDSAGIFRLFMEIMQVVGYTVRDASLAITEIVLRVFDDLVGYGGVER